MKPFFLVTLMILRFCTATAQQPEGIPMTWKSDDHSPYAALLLPVLMEGKSYQMQLDLGSPHSFLYKHLAPGDTARPAQLTIGPYKLNMASMQVRDPGVKTALAGTLGADIIRDKVVIFDYPNGMIYLEDSLPTRFYTRLYPFYFAGNRVLLPTSLLGKQVLLYFDTGSSAFELLTDSTSWRALSVKNASIASYEINSWGRKLIVSTAASADSIEVAGRRLPLNHVSYIQGASEAQVSQMKKTGMGGMTGNTLFINHVLILDTKRSLFGILESIPVKK
ncbi:MAG TPA: hypothetical protein VFR58_11440 [Flavisolibacter sp.]|nr:hypothetical protein [Flavisolibacter sp.]